MDDAPMNGLFEQFAISFRLYFRNKMGMFYGYLFPAIFLLAFRVLYRNEPVPMARHMGQLLTVTILGGACLGMPTTMVSERERGVWRRYRLTPVSTRSLVVSTVILRYFIVITAGLLQFALAMAIGMPLPVHPFDLCIAFTFASFAFLGLGLVVATMADTVPSVQALGQCIFLPMLIIGGVAVPLASLPDWAQHVAAFFPGRYAVESLQATITGSGAGAARFDFLALFLIGLAGCAAGAGMFRWDAGQRFAARGKVWLVAVIAAWAVVGGAAEFRGRVIAGTPDIVTPAAVQIATLAPATEAPPAPAAKDTTPAFHRSTSWQEVTIAEINHNVDFRVLPPDGGVVSPIARPGLDAPPEMVDQLNDIADALPNWPPGNVTDPVQRVRNLLYVAAVPDVLETEIIESYVPLIVFDRIKQVVPKDDLIRILFWVAVHPSSGDDSAANQLQPLGLGNAPSDMDSVRERVTYYSLKLLGRMIGRIASK
jgi:ABC-type polysaccharide/polyol phosphate export permease